MNYRASEQVCTWAVVLAIGATSAAVRAEESVFLKAKRSVGDTAYVEIEKRTVQAMSGGMYERAPMRVSSGRTLGLATRVVPGKSVGSLLLEGTFERAQWDIDVVGNTWAYDSDAQAASDPDNMLGVVLGPLLGASIKLPLDAQGEVISCQGMARILADIRQASAAHPHAEQFLEQGQTAFTDDAMKFLWGDLREVMYPDREVKVGDTWQRSLWEPMPYIGAVTREYNFTVRKIGDQDGRQVVIVDYEGTIQTAPDAQPVDMVGGMRVEFEGGRLAGTATYDVERGVFVTRVEDTQDRRATGMPAKGQPGLTRKVIMDQTIRTTITNLSEAQRQARRSAAGR